MANNNQYAIAQKTYGVGTIYVNLYNVNFKGYNNFESNLGIAVHIINGIIDMSLSSGNFFQNFGIQGGAIIALIGESLLIIETTGIHLLAMLHWTEVVQFNICNHVITSSRICFIQYNDHNTKYIPASEWNSTVVFNGNRTLSEIVHTIFSTSVYSCQTIINTGCAE